MAYLRCPECRLTAPAAAYYLRGDQCPRCLTPMEPVASFRDSPAVRQAAEDTSSVASSSRAG